MPANNEQVRTLTSEDVFAVERLLRTSEYIYQRFTQDELSLLLKHSPAVGFFNGTSLHGFLLSQIVNPPSAWLGGFGISWTESKAYNSILTTLLEALSPLLTMRGVRYLHYSGNDAQQDWLRTILLTRGFLPYRSLFAYDKYDYHIPSSGNQQVTVRPVKLSSSDGSGDMAALLAIEEACFEQLWRYDHIGFADIATTHPYFVVAELNEKVVGYQFNAVDNEYGYLIRIAVHPAVGGQGIGARLMAEAIRFFKQERVLRIMLNTQEDNIHAHRLYEWFGFIRLEQTGFVLRKHL